MKIYKIGIDSNFDLDWDKVSEERYDLLHGRIRINYAIPRVKCCNGACGYGLLPYKVDQSFADEHGVNVGGIFEIEQFQRLKQKLFNMYGPDPEVYFLYPGCSFLPFSYTPPKEKKLDWLFPFFTGINIINNRLSKVLGDHFKNFIKLEKLDQSDYYTLIARIPKIDFYKCYSVEPCERCGRVWVRRDSSHPEVDPAISELQLPIFQTPITTETYVNQSFKEMLEDFGVVGIVFSEVEG